MHIISFKSTGISDSIKRRNYPKIDTVRYSNHQNKATKGTCRFFN